MDPHRRPTRPPPLRRTRSLADTSNQRHRHSRRRSGLPDDARDLHRCAAGLGFAAETSADGFQHRWRRDLAQIDVLIPEGIGERAAARAGAGGAPTLSAPGTTQALSRSEPVSIVAAGRTGTVRRPNLVGALVGKAAARTEIASDRASARHCTDFVVLAGLISARDFREAALTAKDRTRLRKMLTCCRTDGAAMAVDNAVEALARLERAAGLSH